RTGAQPRSTVAQYADLLVLRQRRRPLRAVGLRPSSPGQPANRLLAPRRSRRHRRRRCIGNGHPSAYTNATYSQPGALGASGDTDPGIVSNGGSTRILGGSIPTLNLTDNFA